MAKCNIQIAGTHFVFIEQTNINAALWCSEFPHLRLAEAFEGVCI